MLHFRLLAGSVLALWLLIPGGRAQATALFADTVLVKGPEYLTVLELPIDTIGSYKVTATDLRWLNVPLQGLSFGVFTSTQSLKSMQGPGSFEFYKAGSDKVFLQIYSKTMAPKFAGLVSIIIEHSAPAVSLPSSALLLLSAIVGVVLLPRLSPRRQCVECA